MTDSFVSQYPDPTLLNLRSSRRSHSPLAFLETLTARGDAVPFLLAGRPAVLLNRPDHVSAVLLDESNFRKGSANQRAKHLLGNGLLTADGHLHAERRRLIQPAFAKKRLDACAAVVVRRAHSMCDRWQSGRVVDLTESIGRLTFGIVGEAIVGRQVDDEFCHVRDAVSEAIASLDPLVSLVAPLRRVRRAQARLHAVVERVAARAGAGESEGSLIALLNAYDGDGGGQPSAQRVDDLLTILLAGHDTITSALTWTFALVAAHPEVERALRDEWQRVLSGRDPGAADVARLVYTRAVLAESLRLYPPAWVLARHAMAPYRFDDTEVATGTVVLVSQYLLHRDERFFARPRAFDPCRWVDEGGANRPRFAYFPFGAGTRACIGEAFGWMEGVLLLATIGQRWRLQAASAFPEIDLRITMRPRGQVLMRPEMI